MTKLTYIPVRGEEVTAETNYSLPAAVLDLEANGWTIVLALKGAIILSNSTDRVVVH